MLSPLRNRFGIPGVISVVALVFAMLGGAYAASNSSDGGKATASAKAKRGPKGPKGATGPAGPAGPVGPQGPAGANGKDGANGSNGAAGAAGTAGKSVTSAPFEGTDEPIGAECFEAGGIEFKSASPTTYACNGTNGENGENGDPWTAGGTLPVGSTETGAWSFQITNVTGEAGFITVATLSFTVPLATALEEEEIQYVTVEAMAEEEVPSACENESHSGSASVANPEAKSGHLCVYEAQSLSGTPFAFALVTPISGFGGTNTFGARLRVFLEEDDPAFGVGSWAVTG